jgi:hypothetical protein
MVVMHAFHVVLFLIPGKSQIPICLSKLLPGYGPYIDIIAFGCRGTQDSCSSDDRTPGSKPTYRSAAERTQLLDALRHSQTRAREAEMAAKKAYDEKDHVIKLLFRQASHLFACKQWLKMLQLENICLQLRLKEHQIAAMFPELPWIMLKEKVTPGQERKDGTRKKGRKQNKDSHLRKAVVFAVGVGIVGAGLLLGWTLGWLLPRL